jgi:hypothetical protein
LVTKKLIYFTLLGNKFLIKPENLYFNPKIYTNMGRIATPKTEITGVNSFPTKGTLPKGRTLTGTFSSIANIVTGTGTLFTTELAGMQGWLYSTTDNELRMFTQINGDENMVLDKPFTNNQTDQAMIVCTPLYMSLGARSSHSTINANLNNDTFPVGTVKNFNFDVINPITYDAASGANMGEITFDLAY